MNIRLTELDMFFIFRQRMNEDEAEALTNFVFEKLAEEPLAFSTQIIKVDSQLYQKDSHQLTRKIIAAKEKRLKCIMAATIIVFLFLALILQTGIHL